MRNLVVFLALAAVVGVGSASASEPKVTIQLFDKGEAHTIALQAPVLADGSAVEIPMRSASGTKFICSKASNEANSPLDVEQACILSSYDAQQYWQYELCIGSNVSQVHIEDMRVQSRVLLGTFKKSEGLSQIFEAGSGGRSAKVTFMCDQNAEKPRINRADESFPLKYTLSVSLKAACDHQLETPLESLPCVEAVASGSHFRVCPTRSVSIKKELTPKGQTNIPVEYLKLESTTDLKRRRQEVFVSDTMCDTSPDTALRARISYQCTPKQQWPLLLGFERAPCELFIRVAVASVCESTNVKVNCRVADDEAPAIVHNKEVVASSTQHVHNAAKL